MKAKILAVVFTLTVIWAQGALLFSNGLFDRHGNLTFYDFAAFRDVTVHLSLIQELLNRFPPTNFAAGGLPLKNYHYFFDVLLSVFAKIPGVSILDLYFRIAPVVLSIGLCAVIYATTLQITKKKLVAAFAIFFTVFATSFGPIVPLFTNLFGWNHVTGAGNIFMTDQIFSMMVNPQGILSLILYLSIFLALSGYEKSRKIFFLLLAGFFLSISFGVKAYGGILFVPAAFLAGLWFLYKERDWKPLVALGAGVALMGLWFLYSIDSRVAGLTFAPFWLLGRMMADIDRLNEPSFALVSGKRLFWLVPVEFIIFLIGSLGLRVLGLLSIVRKFSPSLIFLYATGIFSLLLPLFFNQTTKAYEVIQFFPYFSLLMGILFTISVFTLLEKRNRLVKTVVLLLLVSVFLLFDKRELDQKINGRTEKIVIAPAELSAVEFIRQTTDPAAIFLLAPSEFNSNYLWFTALTGRRVVYAGSRFEQQIGVDKNNIPRRYDYVFVSQALDGGSATISDRKNLTQVFEKDGAKVYKYEQK